MVQGCQREAIISVFGDTQNSNLNGELEDQPSNIEASNFAVSMLAHVLGCPLLATMQRDAKSTLIHQPCHRCLRDTWGYFKDVLRQRHQCPVPHNECSFSGLPITGLAGFMAADHCAADASDIFAEREAVITDFWWRSIAHVLVKRGSQQAFQH